MSITKEKGTRVTRPGPLSKALLAKILKTKQEQAWRLRAQKQALLECAHVTTADLAIRMTE